MRRRDFNLAVSAFALSGLTGVGAQGFDIEGKYHRIMPTQPTESPEGQVEVLEVFGYRCPHCFRFLPTMERFERATPGHVHLRRMPAIFHSSWELPARAFYTAKYLGVLDKLHRPIFEALHVDKRSMDDVASWRKLFIENGVSPVDFDKTFKSFAVDAGVRKSVVMQGRYGVSGTPSLVINGKYRVPAGLSGGYENMIRVALGLAERERKLSLSSG